MHACQVKNGRAVIDANPICADLFDGDDFAHWVTLVAARVLGRVTNTDGSRNVIVQFDVNPDSPGDIIDAPSGAWMLDMREAGQFGIQ